MSQPDAWRMIRRRAVAAGIAAAMQIEKALARLALLPEGMNARRGRSNFKPTLAQSGSRFAAGQHPQPVRHTRALASCGNSSITPPIFFAYPGANGCITPTVEISSSDSASQKICSAAVNSTTTVLA
jgi:hypothetical protein